MDAYFSFTDECGVYEKIRSEKFLKANPFYVRATVIISLEDYLKLQEGIDSIKELFGLKPNIEVKWSHLGSAIKNNYSKIPHQLTVVQLNEYFTKVLELLTTLNSVNIYYTFTKLDAIGQIDYVPLLKMHLQNALQKIQTTVAEKDGFAIVIADDLNDKSKALKQAVYELTLSGDYVKYTNIKKGLYIDFSNQCQGLQVADICAGTFTATLKSIVASDNEKTKFKYGYDLFMSRTYVRTRNSFYNAPYYNVYRFGVKEVPHNKSKELAIQISKLIEEKLEDDLKEIMNEYYSTRYN